MAKKAEESIIFHGKHYAVGDELPDDYGKYPPKTARAVPKEAPPAAPNQPEQTNRPGMSGSGKPQGKEDIVDERGHTTHPAEDFTAAAGSQRKLDESEATTASRSHVDRTVADELEEEGAAGTKSSRGKK